DMGQESILEYFNEFDVDWYSLITDSFKINVLENIDFHLDRLSDTYCDGAVCFSRSELRDYTICYINHWSSIVRHRFWAKLDKIGIAEKS
ncbi:hypothetical protein, partial [Photobacterium damselae]